MPIWFSTGQMTQVIRRLPLVWETWGSNPVPIKSLTRCLQFATAAILKCGP